MKHQKHERAECRVCGRDSAVNADEEIRAHNGMDQAGFSTGRRCLGAGRPPKGEPPCGTKCGRTAGSVHYPPDLFTRADLKVAHAATHVCFDPEHQAEAAEWVKSKTGHKGVYEPFQALQASARADGPGAGKTVEAGTDA